ncbi:MAG: tetratricopeptide repeat protein, partial [Actinobacteria bacterium]|nr:tetratricopeptide repeat protein [Actinomycetota bacterium]
ESYLNGVEILKGIRANHPDSNEAFIANYKIPEYLLKAALSYKSSKNWDQAIKVLEEITSDYSESEFSVRASSLLFDIYIEKSMNLKDSYKYRESIEEFLKVLELKERNKDRYMFVYYSKRIFEGISLSLLETVGGEMQSRREYEKALFVYDKILEFYPESKEKIIPHIVECKVEIISASPHMDVVQPESSQRIYSPGKTRVVIKNETEYNLVIYFEGPELKLVELKPKAGVEVELLSGTYKVAGELTGENGENIDVLPFYGIIKYEENQRYREVYSI